MFKDRAAFASLRALVAYWFGVSAPVGPLGYATSGLGLAALKYGVEAGVIWLYTARVLWPWDFVNPVLDARLQTLGLAPDWLSWGLFLWSLPFLWIAVSMSVRRAADAGGSPWLGMLVLVPLMNLLVMLMLSVLPRAPGERWTLESRSRSEESRAASAALAVGVSLVIGGIVLWISVYLLSSYGTAVFLGAPVMMGATASYQFNRPHARDWPSSIGVGLASVFFAAVALLLFALEGLICVAMATPLMLPLGVLGGAVGKAIADATRRSPTELVAAVIFLPILAGGESLVATSREYVVLTAVDIDAPPEVVWEHVVEFPDLPAERDWYFRLGIACPERARIVGRGPGATRLCEFTTGAFVEPITHWEKPSRLGFDVAGQPAPMFELSPYRHVHPPHLDGHLRSTRGEFRLIPLPDHDTRLEGRTWYKFDMFPQSYWTLWSDLLIHRIHLRVLRHIKQLSEEAAAGKHRSGTDG